MIFYVEDDQEIRNLILYTLHAAGFKAMGFNDATALYDEISETKPELIMLDIMLPKEDGLSILRRLKEEGSTKTIPVILVTAKGSEYDKVTGLEMGADDYLVKPFGMMEMVARIKALLRRTKQEGHVMEKLVNGPICIDENRHMAFVGGDVLRLTLKEYDLLRLFLSGTDRVYTRESLLEEVWGESFIGESRTVDVHIGTLRTKLGDAGSLIETVRGVGYKMVKAS